MKAAYLQWQNIGQIKVATQTHPSVSFDVLDLSKTIKLLQTKSNQSKLIYPYFKTLDNMTILVDTDASYANLSVGVSSA